MRNIVSTNVIVTLSRMVYTALLTKIPHLEKVLKAQLAHPLLVTSHSKSICGRVLETSILNKDKPGGRDKNPTLGRGRFLVKLDNNINYS